MHLSGIPMDVQGLQMNALAALAQREHRRGGTILYTIPTNQNPTGITMSLPRREAVLRFGAENRLPIIEDGAYEELCFSPAPPSLKALDRAGTVLYLGSASKSLAPGLRIGWVVASEPIVQRLGDVKMQTDYGASSIEYTIYCWCTVENYWPAYHSINEKLRDTFAKHNVEMTYDHLNVHILDK